MKSVVLDTINDIGLILHAYDLGGCTKGAPLDEYMHEAAEIFVAASNQELFRRDQDNEHAVNRLHDIIDDVFACSFGDLYQPAQSDVDQIARSVLLAFRANVEMHHGKKVDR